MSLGQPLSTTSNLFGSVTWSAPSVTTSQNLLTTSSAPLFSVNTTSPQSSTVAVALRSFRKSATKSGGKSGNNALKELDFKLNHLTTKEEKADNPVMKAMAKAFNNPQNSDLKFKLKKKGNEELSDAIHVHKWYIEERVGYFGRMFANGNLFPWKENESNEVPISGYSYEAYHGFLKYLYTNCIDTQDVDLLLEMLSIGEEYVEPVFKDECVRVIRQLVTNTNVCTIYSDAIKLNAEELEEFCFKTIVANHKAVVDTEDFKSLDPKVAKHLLTNIFDNYDEI